MILIPFPLLLLEIFLFIWFSEDFGFFATLAAYFLPSFLGFALLSSQSRAALESLQRRLQEGGEPAFQVLNAAAKFIAGVLFVIPLFTTRILGVLLLLPGTRHVMVLIFRQWLVTQMMRGRMNIFGRGFPPPRRPHQPPDEGPREERDAKVIDVVPLRSERTDKKGE